MCVNPNSIIHHQTSQKLSPKHAAPGVAQSPYPIYRHGKACLSKQPPWRAAGDPRLARSRSRVRAPGPAQTLHARIRFAPSSVECRPWHLLTWPESVHCLLGHLHWRPWPAKHVRGYNRAYNCEWMSGTVHINWIMFLGTCFHWQKVFIILRCRKLLKIALDLRWSVWFLGSQGAWKPEHAVWICAEQVMELTCLQEKSKIFWAETHAICQRTLEVFKCWEISNRTSWVAKCLASDFDRKYTAWNMYFPKWTQHQHDQPRSGDF